MNTLKLDNDHPRSHGDTAHEFFLHCNHIGEGRRRNAAEFSLSPCVANLQSKSVAGRWSPCPSRPTISFSRDFAMHIYAYGTRITMYLTAARYFFYRKTSRESRLKRKVKHKLPWHYLFVFLFFCYWRSRATLCVAWRCWWPSTLFDYVNLFFSSLFVHGAFFLTLVLLSCPILRVF